MDSKYKINLAAFISSYTSWKSCGHSNNNEYAFIGRSNVGKSTLINMITGRKNLALVSKKPGKTKLINQFLINDTWNLVDLPGYGYAKVSKTERKSWIKLIDDYILKRKNLVNVFVLIDSNIPPQAIDIEFINHLGANQIAFSIVFTKIDKGTKNKVEKNLNDFKKNLYQYWENLPPIFKCSGITKAGRDDILEYIFKLNDEIKFN